SRLRLTMLLYLTMTKARLALQAHKKTRALSRHGELVEPRAELVEASSPLGHGSIAHHDEGTPRATGSLTKRAHCLVMVSLSNHGPSWARPRLRSAMVRYLTMT